MRSQTDTLVSAMLILARDIHCEDGVATAAITEAATRLLEQADEIASLRLTDSEREAIRRLRPSADPLASVTVTLTPAERTVFHGLLERLGDKGEARMSDTDERSGASAGSVKCEPAAWGVMRVGGGWRCIVDNERQAASFCKGWDRAENWVHEAIPLYRHCQPTLTDAEREAVEYTCGVLLPDGSREGDGALHVLRGLLERLG